MKEIENQQRDNERDSHLNFKWMIRKSTEKIMKEVAT